MKKLFLTPILLLSISSTSFSMSDRYLTATAKEDSQVLLIQKNEIEKIGRSFEMKGDFDSAAQKYREAADMDIKIYGSDKGRPLAALAEVREKQGRYEESLSIVRSLIEFHPQQINYIDWREELEALIQSKRSGDFSPVQRYIVTYIEKYKLDLPPQGYGFGSIPMITRVLALYDTIGDCDAGIKYIDEVLDYKLSKNQNIVRPTSSDQAMELSVKTDTLQDRKNRRPYEVLAEYLRVREAFEQDKAEGKKGSMKEGKPGRATLALIQSDYFPW